MSPFDDRHSRCGKVQFIAEVHAGRWRDRMLRQILAKLPGRAELWTGSDVASSRPVRKIVLRE